MAVKGKQLFSNMDDDKSDIERILAPALYILNNLGNKINKHKLFKILYFADKEHILKYGRTFSDESYIKMKDGPVPSKLFDYIRLIEGKYPLPVSADFSNEISLHLNVQGKWVLSLKKVKVEYLSKSAIKSLDRYISEFKSEQFDTLRDLSHDSAWHAAEQNREMSIIDIARDAGANDDMIAYMKEST